MVEDVTMKLEITQDKLFDMLMHAATREDLNQLDNKVDKRFTEVDQRVERLESKMDKHLGRIDDRLDRVQLFIMAGILVPIVLFVIQKMH